jgi:hypothetical protein
MFDDGRRYFERIRFGAESDSEIKQKSEELVFKNKWIEFFNDEVVFPNGVEGKFLRLQTPNRDGTVVVAVKPNTSEIALVKQYRYAPGLWMVELPRGFAIEGDLSGILTGWRELLEETGEVPLFQGIVLGRLVTDSGKLADAPYLVLFEVPISEGSISPRPDDTEVLAPEKFGYWVEYRILKDWVETGLILDAFTCAAMARIAPHFDAEGKYDLDLDKLDRPHLRDAERMLRGR